MRIEPLARLDLAGIDTLVFAGGGNRCWWQAGVIAHCLEQGWQLPAQLVGTSGGAAVAASFLTTGPKLALDACVRLFAGNQRMFDWHGLTRLRLHFAHRHTYPAWLATFVNAEHFTTLRQSSSRLLVAVTRPARALGMGGSVAAGTLAYLVDKFVRGSLHPRLPKLFGLRQDFLDLQACTSVEESQSLLIAAAAAQPFIPAQRIAGRFAFDGGYTDNAPLPPQNTQQKVGTLVLLTRHYPKLPTLFRWNGRHYWQPSRRIPVSMIDCTMRATVREAFALGEHDTRYALARGALHID